MLFLNEGYGKEINKMIKGGKRGISQIVNKLEWYGLRVPEGTLEVLKNGKKEVNWEGIEELINSPLSRSEQDHVKREVFTHTQPQ